jgi:hypothetical protein
VSSSVRNGYMTEDTKEIKGVKVGRAWRFEQADVDEYVARQRRKAEESAA